MNALNVLLAVVSATGLFRHSDLGNTPFPMDPIPEYVFPERSFNVCDYGAKPDGSRSDAAIQQTIDACAASGGGRVVVPSGTFYCAPIRLKSNVELHLEAGATLEFTDRPEDCLPAVPSSWEGLECVNYSPMVYAYGCTNVALTGRGTLVARMDGWRKHFREAGTGILDARRILYTWGSTDYPVEKRNMPKAHKAVMRPQLVQFNRAKNVRIEGIELKDSPFWTLHLFMSENVVVRGLRTNCYGFNNDGIDIEMTRNVLVEDCEIRAGDDGFVFKAGRNRDAWRVNRPTENVVVRNCKIIDAVSLAAIGSELSGGIRNIWIHDCSVAEVARAVYVKTNRRRGGFVANIQVENVTIDSAFRLMAIETNVLYQWGVFPDYELRLTPITNLKLRNVLCCEAREGVFVAGDAKLPIDGISLENVVIDRLQERMSSVSHASNVRADGFVARSFGTVKNKWCDFIPRRPPPTVAGSERSEYETPWRGTKAVIVGDLPMAGLLAPGAEGFWKPLAQKLGVSFYVYGTADGGMDSVLREVRNARADLYFDTDSFFIFAGGGDFDANVPLGAWYETREEDAMRDGRRVRITRRSFSHDEKTFRGRVNRLMSYLRETFFDHQIVLVTPLRRGKTQTRADETVSNEIGVFFDEYVEAIREASRIWSVPLMDLNVETGLFPCSGRYSRFFMDAETDMRHLGPLGDTRVAKTILSWMLAHPADYKRNDGMHQ